LGLEVRLGFWWASSSLSTGKVLLTQKQHGTLNLMHKRNSHVTQFEDVSHYGVVSSG
jgi:hypothetical protein